jgi:hypothetical protein
MRQLASVLLCLRNVQTGRLFRLNTGTLSALGTEHEQTVISAWNLT